ncbi:DNA recombination protein RmuC [Thiomicrospira sp. WB1]|uniref:DNA recombination protein RmuC n=1 Tax=Thiomicrospira sp. WB1 TaxID=1685380 RepID=UPI000746A6EE|nr:DNA recombination protein RmuC [Thiomicrospira sp. WB1]KUJ72740.1 recombinase RmuC [Thiomicrospira sp. WB1]
MESWWQNSVEMPWLLLSGLVAVGALIWGWRLQQRLTRALQNPPGLVDLQAENTRLQTQLADWHRLQGEHEAQSRALNQYQAELAEARAEHQRWQEKYQSEATERASLMTQLKAQEQAYEEKLALLEEAKQRMTEAFEALSNDILKRKQSELEAQSQKSLRHLLEPMHASMEQFKTRMETVHKENLEGRASLKTQLEQLQSLNQQISEEAHNLTHALKGDQKLQGNWGEQILKRLLERSGLREGQEFESEKSFTQEDGTRLRPDVIVNLPDRKHVIIDAKVSLLEYEKALNAATASEKEQAIKAHLASLKKHIQALSHKRYDHIERLHPPDFVLMFVPIEGAYLLAVEKDPTLFETAFEQKVAVVTPTTLFTTLKTIEQLWRYERQSEHTMKLIKRAADVHDKFVGFVTHFEKIGKQLNTLNSSYDTARKQMMAGQGNLVRQAEMLKELAGKTRKEMPEHLLEEAEGSAILGEPTDR